MGDAGGGAATEGARLGGGDAALSRRPEGPLIWLHAPNLRDARALCHAAARLRDERDDLAILLTRPPGLTQDMIPPLPGLLTDRLPAPEAGEVAAFLKEWHPDLAIWSRGPLQPRLITAAAQDMPIILLNFDGAAAPAGPLQRMLGAEKRLLRQFTRILAPTPEIAQAVRRNGAESTRVEVAGWLQESMPPLPVDAQEHEALAAALGGRPLWLAAGTVPQEEPDLLRAHRQVSRLSHRLLLVLLPESAERGPELAGQLVTQGWRVALRSEGELPQPETQIYVADRSDELGLWYRLAPVSFLGASLARGPGRDPFEAASLGSAVIHGPNVAAFRDAYERLGSADAARLVRNAGQLAEAVEVLLAPHHAAAMAHAAWDIASRGAEVTDRLIEIVMTSLDDRGL